MFNSLQTTVEPSAEKKEGDIENAVRTLKDTATRCQSNFKSLRERLSVIIKSHPSGEGIAKTSDKPSLSPLAAELDSINDLLLSLEGWISYTEREIEI